MVAQHFTNNLNFPVNPTKHQLQEGGNYASKRAVQRMVNFE